MLNKQPTNKWDMCKNIDLKESMESSTFVSNWKSIKKSKHGESESKRCWVCNAQIISNDVRAEVRGVRALFAHTNSPTHLKVKFHSN